MKNDAESANKLLKCLFLNVCPPRKTFNLKFILKVCVVTVLELSIRNNPMIFFPGCRGHVRVRVVFHFEALLIHVGLKTDEEHVIWSEAQEQILNGTLGDLEHHKFQSVWKSELEA